MGLKGTHIPYASRDKLSLAFCTCIELYWYPWLPVSPGNLTSFAVVAINIIFSLSIYCCHKSRHALVVM